MWRHGASVRWRAAKSDTDELLELLQAHPLKGTCRRASLARGRAMHPGGRFLKEPIPVELLYDGPIVDKVRDMLPGAWVNRVSISRNHASTEHADGANAGLSWTMMLGEFEGGRLCVEGKPPFAARKTWLPYHGNLRHWVEPILSAVRWSVTAFYLDAAQRWDENWEQHRNELPY